MDGGNCNSIEQSQADSPVDPDHVRGKLCAAFGIMAQQKQFTLKAPHAKNVVLVGNFTEWEKNAIELKHGKNGTWKASVSLEPGKHEYLYIVDGGWHGDPECNERVANPYGGENCIKVVS